MARQVLPIVGAVAGFVVGGPTGAQIGFALGSLVGNAVDPIEMQGRKLGDAPTQVAAEGGARAIVYGKGCIRATVVMERGGRRVIKQRDRSGGKGGGPTTINERALWTFAIGLGEPVAAVLRIWENEKLVYDVTPTSTIPEDTAEFAQRFRFYTGAEDQLPDPALEVLHGIGNTPYYRGTAYMVFPQYDLTDFGETVPTYRVEVAAEADASDPDTVIALASRPPPALGSNRAVIFSPDGADWDAAPTAPGVVPSGVEYIAASSNRVMVWGAGTDVYVSSDNGGSWPHSINTINRTGGTRGSYGSGAFFVPAGANGLLRSVDNGLTLQQVTTVACNIVAVDDSGLGVILSNTGVSCAYTNDGGSSWTEIPIPFTGSGASTGTPRAHAFDGQVVLTGERTVTGVRIARTINGSSWGNGEPSLAGATIFSICAGMVGDVTRWVIGLSDGRILWSDNVLATSWTVGASTSKGVRELVWNGTYFIACCDTASNGDGEIFYSTDATSWTSAPLNIPVDMFQMAVLRTQPTIAGEPIPLSTVVGALHLRCGSSEYDVSELGELIDGVVIESTSTAAESINSLIGSHFADPSDYDGQIHYIKRGKPVVLTLTEDDLIDEPDEAQRNNAIEYPKKVHFLGQRADLAYASSKSTSARYSDDAKVVGEITIGSPETYNDAVAPAEVAVKLHKVLWTEAEGERGWMIPDNYLGLVPTDNVGLSYRGELVRCRIINVEDTPGQRKLRMIRDRQSAYTANLTEIPNPPAPTPPQSSVVAPTIMAFIDTSALTDNADTLHYLVALSGANDNWAGAALQQQLGGNFTTIDSTTLNSVMGTVQNTVYDASQYYTDTTNEVVVRLFTDDDLEAQTEELFLTNGGAFFLSWEDSGNTYWEIMQYRDAVQDSNGDWVLSHLMRGRKNTETAEHPPGAMFVWIDPAILREPAQTAWLNTVLTHRAVSNGQPPELAAPQDNLYVGNSQKEWPVANLLLSRPTGTSVEAEAIPRHRFGSSMNPIRSVNWEGYRWTATDGANTINRDGTAAIETFDTTGWASPVTVTVAQLNRLTGAGPSVSEVIV